jgi:hypothetical protein
MAKRGRKVSHLKAGSKKRGRKRSRKSVVKA